MQRQKKIDIKSIVFLQLIILIYTFSTVANKIASNYQFLSGGSIGFLLLSVALLGVYALLWQQALKKFDLHVAYTNRMLAIVWSMVWSALIFQERITLPNIIGTIIIVAGAVLVNSDVE